MAVAVYEDRKISFEFYIMPIYRNIGVELADGVKQKCVEVAVYIDQSSVQRGLNFTLRAKGRPSLSDVASSQFLKQLKEGIFVWATWGGAKLQDWPDYRVDFVPSRKDLNAVLQPGEMRMGQAGP